MIGKANGDKVHLIKKKTDHITIESFEVTDLFVNYTEKTPCSHRKSQLELALKKKEEQPERIKKRQ